MTASATPNPSSDSVVPVNPVLAEVTRGNAVESRHRGRFAVVDADGRVVLSAGDVEAAVFPRSAIKPLQALPLIESGAAEAYGLSDAEIALACASHSGEPAHVEAVAAWLARIGCGESDLVCGGHPPRDRDAARALIAAGKTPTRLHDNCSGKHTGFLTLARQLGQPTAGYADFAHPVQQTILGVLEQMTGLDDLTAQPRGIDGCGIPALALPLGNVALAMARLADPDDQPDRRRNAAARVRRAMATEPWMVAGSGRVCTEIMRATGERALVKVGAEGVYCAALPDLGLGLALKIDDGAERAADVVLGRLLRRLEILPPDPGARLRSLLTPAIHDRAGHTVGEIRPASDFPVQV